MAVKDATRAKAALVTQVSQIAWLRGTGPNPFEYTIWDARTVELLTNVFGPESPELEAYEAAAGLRGRLPGVRGQAENMTLNIHGPWGILARLDRAEGVLARIITQLG
ncbi:MAG: hypothetical protein ACKVVT_17940 [Dehalococcoidia bacterium]